MNTPEQPASPPLTRKQLRELRNTGATPIVSAVATEEPAESDNPDAQQDAPSSAPAEAPPAPAAPPVPPLPRAAAPAPVSEPPAPDSSVDLGVAPLTRRQARQQERIRTASVPVITPEVAAAHTAANAAPPAPAEAAAEQQAPAFEEQAPAFEEQAPAFEEQAPAFEEHTPDVEQPEAEYTQPDAGVEAEPAPPAEERVVNPQLGAALAGGAPAAEVPPSFDQLLSPSSSGSSSTPNALILSQTPSAAPLVAPVTAAGDVILTGTFNLPDGLGSTGHATGTADGKEVDAVLVDGELPAHSSPTPIAASSAVSTSKSAGEVISPPTPEQGSRLMMMLAITAGVLALALVGVLILAFVTGVFS